MKKSYIVTLKEDIGPYLVKRTAIAGITKKELYTFLVPLKSIDRQTFVSLARRYKCWEYKGADYYTYMSSSSTMRIIADNMEVEPVQEYHPTQELQKESVNDIPDHILDSNSYVQQYVKEYQCNFKQMEKKVNKDKFSAKNKTYITVNGKEFTLTSPFDADASLGVILELTERLAILTGKIDQLNTINDTNDQTDLIAIDNVVVVATNEMSDIKEMIDFINDNIEEIE